jgi:hypothetical protein
MLLALVFHPCYVYVKKIGSLSDPNHQLIKQFNSEVKPGGANAI